MGADGGAGTGQGGLSDLGVRSQWQALRGPGRGWEAQLYRPGWVSNSWLGSSS